MPQLNNPAYLSFPFSIASDGARTSERKSHVREQIEQVLFTNPEERVFRPEFGAGVRSLIFEPNASPLWKITCKRLTASLAEALQGEVDPKTLEVEVRGEGEKLLVVISYALATIDHAEQHEFMVGSGG
jgi:phage baseplate assembly protein W